MFELLYLYFLIDIDFLSEKAIIQNFFNTLFYKYGNGIIVKSMKVIKKLLNISKK